MSTVDTATRDILAAGLRAPSAENQHFLRFGITTHGVDLLSTDLPTWSAQPHRKLLGLISYGAVVENMALRSIELGLETHVSWLPDPDRPDLIASLRWSLTTAAANPIATAVPSRHTHRGFYRRAALPDTTLDRIRMEANAIGQTRLIWLTPSHGRKVALSAIRVAETERFRRQALHQELFGAIRFDIGWKQSVQEGLPPATLGVEPALRLPFAQLRRWPVMRALNLAGGHIAMGLRAGYLPCALAPHLGVIVSDDESVELGFVQAGRALERAWLSAASEGLAFQPMAAVVALANQRPGRGWVSEGAQKRLRALLADLPLSRGRPAMLFRLGAATPVHCATERPPVEHFL